MFCPKCGSEVQDGQAFCSSCGKKLKNNACDSSKQTFANGKEKANEGYITTFPAHNWSFKNIGNSFQINYWYDKDRSDIDVYKIHTFKDKVIFEQADGLIHSIVVTSNYYIHYEGKVKN